MPLAIWNRALNPTAGEVLLEGDEQLAALFEVYNPAMNGGLTHAIDVATVRRWFGAIDGFRYYGFEEAAELLENLLHSRYANEEEATDRFYDLVDTDNALEVAFKTMYAEYPERFAPLSD